MRIYLAATYSRNAEMRDVRERLHAAGHLVTSRWIDQHGGTQLEASTSAELMSDPVKCSKFARTDLDDIDQSDALVLFASNGQPGRGGRHTEFGYALALEKVMYVVGDRENVFQSLPYVTCVADVDALIEVL